MTIINMSGGKPAKPIVVEAVEDTPASLPHTYQPGEGFDYLSSVTVGKDPNLTAGNIKQGVSIFGVEGSYAGSGGGVSKDTWVSPNNNWTITIYLIFDDPSIVTEATDVPESTKYYNIQNKVSLDNRYLLSSVEEMDGSWRTVTGMYHHDAETNVTIKSGVTFNPPVGESGVFGENIWYALYGNPAGKMDTLHGYARLNASNYGFVVASDSDVDVEFTMTPDSKSANPSWTATFESIPEFDAYFASNSTIYSIAFNPYYVEVVS